LRTARAIPTSRWISAIARHLPECEFGTETDPAILKVLLKIKPGLGEGYDWVECGSCGAGWHVPHYAA
jgi:hypothetical protein